MQIRALRESELQAHAELVYVSYSHERELEPGSMLTHPDWWLRSVERDPYYDLAQTRVLVLDGRLIASVTCYSRPTCIADRIAPAACLGSVCTHPEHRRQGYLRQVLAEAIEWMTGAGFLCSFLYGQERVYGGSGWRILTSFDLTADLRVRDDYGRDISARRVDPDRDLPILAGIYERHCSRLTGPTVRSPEYWRRRILSPYPWDSKPPPYYLLELAGTPVAYCAENGPAVTEIAWTDAPREVLAFLLNRRLGEPVSFAFCTNELAEHLRAVSWVPGREEYDRHRGGISLTESYKGLWRYLADPEGLFPEVTDTDSLLRFLREHEYVMWPADRA